MMLTAIWYDPETRISQVLDDDDEAFRHFAAENIASATENINKLLME